MIEYHLKYGQTQIIKSLVVELTSTNSYSIDVDKSDINFLLANYNRIKSEILNNNPPLCLLFMSKISNFYDKAKNGSLVNNETLEEIISIILDCHSLDLNVVNDIISEANSFIYALDKESWLNSLNIANSKIVRLLEALIDTNKYSNSALPLNASVAYSEIMILICKKQNAIPANVPFWGKLYNLQTQNLSATFRDIRDELLQPHHGTISFDEILFFENGLFKHGALDQNQEVADDVLRRMFTPLVSTAGVYIDFLKRNTDNIIKIIQKAKESIIMFKEKLEYVQPNIGNDPSVQVLVDILVRKYKETWRNGQNSGYFLDSLFKWTKFRLFF